LYCSSPPLHSSHPQLLATTLFSVRELDCSTIKWEFAVLVFTFFT
jgi:hypothetical protein